MKLRVIVALIGIGVLTLVFGLVTVSIAGLGHPDRDHDGIMDTDDNCSYTFNPTQQDNDEDGYGNVCDWDVNQDCVAGGPDLIPMFARILNPAPWIPKKEGAFDINQDGVIGGPDLIIVFAKALQPPDPTSRFCADCTAAPGTGVCP